MTAPRTRSLIAQTLIVAVVAVLVLGATQATASRSASASYTAPTYGSVMLDMGDAE